MKKIIVNAVPEEMQAAVLEDGQLTDLFITRPEHEDRSGNIYRGRVENVLPGMEAAFVDIGEAKNAYLYAGKGRSVKNTGKRPGEKLHIGQILPVQINKEETGTKGPRVTTHLTLPGKYLVLLPLSDYIGTSHRINSGEERQRLYKLARELCPENMGIILRTAAEGQPESTLQQEIQYLARLWGQTEKKLKNKNSTGLIYGDHDGAVRIVREMFTEDVAAVIANNRQLVQRLQELLGSLQPEWADRTAYYDGADIFQAYGVSGEIAACSSRRVELASGGFLIIDHTEAMTVIDVNTGNFAGAVNLEDTAFALNLEAAKEIMRQLRLRNIGGIIVVDFIDMDKESHKKELLCTLQQLAASDRVKTKVTGITALGLAEIVRQKTGYSLNALQEMECPVCHGKGSILSPEEIALRVCSQLRQAEKKHHAAEGYVLQADKHTAEALQQKQVFRGLARELGISIEVQAVTDMLPGCYALLGINC